MKLLNINFPKNIDCFEVFDFIIRQTEKKSEQQYEAFRIADKIIRDAECEAVEFGEDVYGVELFFDFLLKHNSKIGIATNNSEECVKKYLDLKGWFEDIPIKGRQSIHPEYMKPSIWSVKTVLDEMNAKSSDTVFIGDGTNDYLSAKKLSMKFIGMASTNKKKSRLEMINDEIVIVENYYDIMNYFNKI